MIPTRSDQLATSFAGVPTGFIDNCNEARPQSDEPYAFTSSAVIRGRRFKREANSALTTVMFEPVSRIPTTGI